MGARHRARAHSIQIMKVQVIAANKCRRPAIKQFHVSLHRPGPGSLKLWAGLSLDWLRPRQLQFKNPPHKKPDSSSGFLVSVFKPGGSETGDRLIYWWISWFQKSGLSEPELYFSLPRTQRSSSLCLTGSCVASTNPASPPRDQTPSTENSFSTNAGKNKDDPIEKLRYFLYFTQKWIFTLLLIYSKIYCRFRTDQLQLNQFKKWQRNRLIKVKSGKYKNGKPLFYRVNVLPK